MFIVELEKGTWLAPWPGDPGRTVVQEHAKYYQTRHGANIALGIARRYRKFDNAMVIHLDNTQHTHEKIIAHIEQLAKEPSELGFVPVFPETLLGWARELHHAS